MVTKIEHMVTEASAVRSRTDKELTLSGCQVFPVHLEGGRLALRLHYNGQSVLLRDPHRDLQKLQELLAPHEEAVAWCLASFGGTS